MLAAHGDLRLRIVSTCPPVPTSPQALRHITARGANIRPSGLRQSLASAVPAYMLAA